MTYSLSGLIIIVALIPAFVLVNGHLSGDIMALLIVANFAAVAATANTITLTHATKVTGGLRVLTILLALWLLFQIMPLPRLFPGVQLSNSLWISASDALGSSLFGHVSIDLGNTAAALVGFIVAITLIVTTIFVARDRTHAEILLYGLCFVTTFAVLELIVVELHLIPSFGVAASRETLSGLGSLGAICNLAALVRLLDRANNSVDERARLAVRGMLVCVAGFCCCILAVTIFAPLNNDIVAWLGLGTFLIIQVVKRWNLAPWSAFSLSFTAVLAAAMIIAWRYSTAHGMTVFLQFANASPDMLQTTSRMLFDAPWTGSGADSFSALWTIYRQPADGVVGQAPTLVAAILIGGGLPMFLLVATCALALFVILIARALGRRRDSHYSSAGAAAVVVLFCQSFCDASLAAISVALTAEIMIGVSLAQSVSQTDHK